MPPKRANIGRKSRKVVANAARRTRETDEERANRLESQREYRSRSRSNRSALRDQAEQNVQDQEEMRRNSNARRVKIESYDDIPVLLRELLSGNTPDSKHFLDKIQTYNNMFQMTSFGASRIVRDNFMPTFKIQGQIYHRIGALLPNPDADYEFLQIYFIGNSDQEVDRRCEIAPSTRRNIVEQLQELLHKENQLVNVFKMSLEKLTADNERIAISANHTPAGQHPGRFNAPTIDEVAILVVGDGANPRDIVLHRRNNNELQRVNELHRSYDALQYPLLFWRGEDQYDITLKMKDPMTGALTTKNLSAMNYYAYKFMIRQNDFNYILKTKKLFHQYAVDMYAKIELERLNYIRFHQQSLRSEEYIHLRDEINNDGNPEDVGQRFILPSTFTGSPRHMHEYAQDAMCYVRNYQRPDLFITFTCNPHWDEIKEHLFAHQSNTDRHDIIARIFKQKLKKLMDFIVKHKVFGNVRCWMYSIEWQKRGLPHAHILIWLVDKIRPDDVDDIISAEIPDKNTDPSLYDVVTKNMVHGPCGTINPNCPCMIDGKCTKRYPRALITESVTGIDGYPLYRRRSPENDGNVASLRIQNRDLDIDNRRIVPYSPLLSKTFNAHINVEYCNSVKSIKYICKYVNKGSDMAMFSISDKNRLDQNKNDEIIQYQLGRYISTNEALWRIFSFNIHERYPTVQHLAVHLENGQRVYFTPENARARVDSPPATTLTAFFKLCETDEFAKTLLYSEVPQYYTWQSNKTFQRRVRGQDLFAIIIATCHPADPNALWNKFCDYMTEDILNEVRRLRGDMQLEYTAEMYNEALIKIEDICLMIASKTVNQCGLIAPNRSMHDAFNQELQRERQYNIIDLKAYVEENTPKLNAKQRSVYNEIMNSVNNKSGGFYFLDAPGGTGKTFLLSLLLAKIRSQQKIALALASSGIAATLLDGGRTAHSALKLPLNIHIQEHPICGVKKRSAMGKVLEQCDIIMWDECTMAHKKSLRALDMTLRDIRKNDDLFGGALILLAGDFRQTLPVIPRSTPADELNACLKISPLWKWAKILRLTENVRVQLQHDPSAAVFSKQLLDIGNGTMAADTTTGLITFPENFCRITQDKDELIQKVFPDIVHNYVNFDWLSERAILAGTNKEVTELNWNIQSKIPGDVISYKSIDTVTEEDDVVHYTTEFLNSLDVPGLPPHNLRLKVGVPIIMLRNMSQPKLCNGTRLAVKKLMNNLIEATILKGKFKGENVLIPRIPMIPTDMPFSFKRLQFPIRIAFAITINKSQGQSMEVCGINLEYPVFSHGQLYVACSRVGKPHALYIYAKDGQTKNIVYRKALN
ncbi:uncharacterized protein LOC129571224 [Sitodiplosis mosellana]|uniref:uncharacterized protein LOC129571224 n=1 Tax=Sitodiplosis mosellana TaxID=263140 RepID=UPI002443C1DB|nr:uncharacterized protein LOC129571224 [Sitodiplosis mosellana]